MNVLTPNDRDSAGNARLVQEEELHSQFSSVSLYFDEKEVPEGNGSLLVTSKRILWFNDIKNDNNCGYAFDIPMITLHAVSTDQESFPHPCLYCQVNLEEPEEIRFVPENTEQLNLIFEAFSHAALLNPDFDKEDFEDNDDDGWICNEEEIEEGSRAANVLSHLESVLQISPLMSNLSVDGQFDDADEELPENSLL